jgi:predicted lipoprotein
MPSFTNLPAGTAALAYAEGLSAVEYLIARFGRSALRNLLDLMAQNHNLESAISKALQCSVSEFAAAWRRDLAR